MNELILGRKINLSIRQINHFHPRRAHIFLRRPRRVQIVNCNEEGSPVARNKERFRGQRRSVDSLSGGNKPL